MQPLFDYHTLHSFYINNSELYDYDPNANAVIYSALAFDKKGNERKFRFKVTHNVPKIASLSEKHKESCPNGILFLLDMRLSDNVLDQIFFLTPKVKKSSISKIYADHFTMQFNPNDKKTPVHVHETYYLPNKSDDSFGVTGHIYGNIPNNIPLPTHSQYPSQFNTINDKEILIDIMRLPFESKGGGTKTKSSKKKTPQSGVFQNKQLSLYCRQNQISKIICVNIHGMTHVVFQQRETARNKNRAVLSVIFEQQRFNEGLIRKRLFDIAYQNIL